MTKFLEKLIEKTLFVQEVLAQGGGQRVPGSGGGQRTPKSLDKIITDLTEFLVDLGVAIAVIIIIYAAYLMMTAGGNAEQFQKGKKTIFYVIAGLAVLLLSAAIISAIRLIIGI